MARLAQRKIQLQIADYEEELQEEAAKSLAATREKLSAAVSAHVAVLNGDLQNRMAKISEYETQLSKRIDHLMKIREDLRAKRNTLTEKFEQAEVQIKHGNTLLWTCFDIVSFSFFCYFSHF